MTTVYTVGALTSHLKQKLEEIYPFVWVKGEVSNMARPSSGHVYFTLKDKDALLQCVWFKGNQRPQEAFDPMTGEVFGDGPRPSLATTLTNGMHILCAGHVTVYAQRGVYQLVVALGHEAGKAGELHAAFEALKARLHSQGYFAAERKRPLPPHPYKVAVLTAPTGAAIQDFVRIAATRGTGSHIRIYPVPVQGDAAAPAIVIAMQEAATWADVIVLIRGGGSLEDLWAFNEEIVAKAVFTCPLPVLAGIGHEVDMSMADMTADVRAATPSHAAQLLWPAREELMQYADTLDMALQEIMQRHVQQYQNTLAMQEKALHWLSPIRLWQRHNERLEQCANRLVVFGQRIGKNAQEKLTYLEKDLQTQVQKQCERQHATLTRTTQTLVQTVERYLEKQFTRLEYLTVRLEAVNPLAPLQRGYALVQTAQGHVISSVESVHKGQRLHLSLADGTVLTDVHDTHNTSLT